MATLKGYLTVLQGGQHLTKLQLQEAAREIKDVTTSDITTESSSFDLEDEVEQYSSEDTIDLW